MKSQNLKCLLLVLITMLLTAFITCFFCKKDDGLIDDGGTRNSASICTNYENEPPVVLTSEMVKSMVGQYSDAQLNNIQTAATNPVPVDARAIWFDLEILKKFLYQVEHNVLNNTAESAGKKIGIRIYYAAYPKNEDMKRMAASQTDPNFSYNPAYENKHTLVMIPTITNAEGENLDFNPLDASTYNGFANMNKTKRDVFNSNSYSTLILGPGAEMVDNVPNNPNGSTSARNHGQLFPPGLTIGFGF